MKEAVFTIAAKNYLAQARTLGDSVKKAHPDLPFYIFLADEAEGLFHPANEKYPIIEVKDIGIQRFREMAFKYDILEFCCAIKPFCFDYLFRCVQYDKVIYFDPDIYVYNSLTPVFELLDNHFLVLTPHIVKLNLNNDGASPEEVFLYSGVYNLGFAALRNCENGMGLLNWWKFRLATKSFADRWDSLHVDQKWIDLVPACFDSGVYISRDPGYNVAQWNMHERRLSIRDGVYFMDDRPLVFFHFAAFDPYNPDRIAWRQSKLNLSNKPEYRDIFESYVASLLNNKYSECMTYNYAYSHFDNGISIFAFQRRLYRRLIEHRTVITDPFSTAKGSFYDLLRVNKLIVLEKSKPGYTRSDFVGSERLIRWFIRGLIILKDVLGIKYFHLLTRLLLGHSRPEDQFFLIEKGLPQIQ